MARVRATATTESEEPLAAATAETVLQVVAASNHPIAIKSLDVTFDGTSATAEPVVVLLVRQTGAGTSSAATPREETAFGVTLQTTARIDFSVEPSSDDAILRRWNVHPQAGVMEKFGPDDEIILGSAARLGIKVTAPAIVNCQARVSWEE
jgi:hypothetical protein